MGRGVLAGAEGLGRGRRLRGEGAGDISSTLPYVLQYHMVLRPKGTSHNEDSSLSVGKRRMICVVCLCWCAAYIKTICGESYVLPKAMLDAHVFRNAPKRWFVYVRRIVQSALLVRREDKEAAVCHLLLFSKIIKAFPAVQNVNKELSHKIINR